jgi:hypothetical protein
MLFCLLCDRNAVENYGYLDSISMLVSINRRVGMTAAFSLTVESSLTAIRSQLAMEVAVKNPWGNLFSRRKSTGLGSIGGIEK